MSSTCQNKKYYKLVHESNKSIVYTSFVGFENYESIMAKKYEIIVCGYLLEILEVNGSLWLVCISNVWNLLSVPF